MAAILPYLLLAIYGCPSVWRWKNGMLSGHLNLRLDEVRNEAMSFGAFQ